ncbi:hypothetical protein GCM10020331_011630 [Ectobacillus funiculus]
MNMSLKSQWLINIAMIVLSWASLPILGRRNIKKFFPASALVVLFRSIKCSNWKNENGGFFIISQTRIFRENFLFNIGPFFYRFYVDIKVDLWEFQKIYTT